MSNAPNAQPFTSGELIDGRFEVDDVLARGGYGMVYLGVDTRSGDDVVIKTLQPDRSMEERTRIRFKREARVLENLSHPNLVSTIAYGFSGDRLYLAMEHVGGLSLQHHLELEGAFSVARVERVLAQLLDGLRAAHDLGVIHRDLKPDNVLLVEGRGDLVKIIDFGVAKLVDITEDASDTMAAKLTAEGVLLGTPGYIPPEVIQGEEHSFSSDLYCAGLIAYELLTGRPAFEGTFIQRVRKQANEEPPPPPSVIAETHLYSIVHKLISPSPDTRYTSARDALDELGVDPAAARGRSGNGSSIGIWLLAALVIVAAVIALAIGLS